jgi:amino acid transporter
VLLLALTAAIPSIPAVLNARDAQGQQIPAVIAIMQSGLGARVGNAMSALASMAMWFCGLSAITSASRSVYSLARDQGTPFSALMRSVSASHGAPAPAIWTIVAAGFVAMLWSGAVPIVTSLSTVALYVAYTIPVILGYRARSHGSDWPDAAVWSLGRWGTAINLIAIIYAVFICIILVMPPNQLAGKTLGGLIVALGLLYWASARRTYRGPEWSRGGSS